jgi:diacylglycerol kinase (ATP)
VFHARGLSFDLAETERAGHASGIVAARGAAYDAVLVAGGDGTLHEAIQSFDLERHRLAVLPWGTGNDFAWLHGFSADPRDVAARISAGGERKVDLGEWEAAMTDGSTRRGRFHNSLGFGFEAVVNHESHRITKIKGPPLYLAALVKALRSFRSYPVRLEWDGGGHEGDVALLALAIGKRVGGAFLLAPAAQSDDGLLDLVFAGRMGRARMLTLLPRTLDGSYVHDRIVRTHRTGAFSLTAPEGIPAYVDGEFIDVNLRSLSARVLPGALRTF